MINDVVVTGEVELTSAEDASTFGCAVEVDGDFNAPDEVTLMLGQQELTYDVNHSTCVMFVASCYS